MEKINFDVCNGLKNISVVGSNQPPTIKQGMSVVLLLNNVEVFIEISSTTQDRKTFFGKVFKTGEGSSTGGSLTGKEVSFIYENISWITQKN